MISLKNVTKKYGDKIVYENFNLDIEEGKITAILGESGSGKSTLIKVIARLTDFEGEISNLPDKISLVFQDDRLVPNLTVSENIKLVNENYDVKNGLKEVGLLGVENSYIKKLSGGMKRRVAVLRGLCYDAPLFILDEPFTSLDVKNKRIFIDLIKNQHKEKNNTVIVVTHDILEAVKIADRIIVLSDKKILYDLNEVENGSENEILKVMMKSYKAE